MFNSVPDAVGWVNEARCAVGRGIQLRVRELEAPTVKIAVERGVAGGRYDNLPMRRGLGGAGA